MSWNQNAFTPIVRAQPLLIFGRPIHLWDGSHRLQPGNSPQAFQIPPRDGHPAIQRMFSSPSLASETSLPLLDISQWPPAERDFNSPDQRAARHTLRAPPVPIISPLLPEVGSCDLPPRWASHVAQISFSTCRHHYPGRAWKSSRPYLFPRVSLPHVKEGSASTTVFRGLLGVYSRYGLPICKQPLVALVSQASTASLLPPLLG